MVKARPVEKVREAEGPGSLGNDSAHTAPCDKLRPRVGWPLLEERVSMFGNVDEMSTGLELAAVRNAGKAWQNVWGSR